LLGAKSVEYVSYDNPDLTVEHKRNLLVIGGPVATDYTRLLCGYKDIFDPADSSLLIPLPKAEFPLPYHFYVGNHSGYGYWGDDCLYIRRWLEDGSTRDFPLYGIIPGPGENPIPSPLNGNDIAGDMLMITRVPHPEKKGGTITIIGGLHGYSLKCFYDNFYDLFPKFISIVNPTKEPFFQALIPFRIDSNRQLIADWESSSDWCVRFSRIDPVAYINYFLPKEHEADA
jgi:hypothetical protein